MTPTGPLQFVILSTQRSGSNWLEDRLAGHADVTMYREEVFRRTLSTPFAYRTYRDARAWRRVAGGCIPPLVKAQYLRWLRLSAPPESPVIGFRLMYDQLRRNPSLALLLPATRTRVIHLVRENLLETLVSVQAARESGLYVTRSAAKKTPTVNLETDGLVAQLERRHSRVERHRHLVRAVPSLEVSYEDYVADAPREDRRILSFLELDDASLGSQVQRSGDRSLRDRIGNVAEVEAVLRSTPFAGLLDS